MDDKVYELVQELRREVQALIRANAALTQKVEQLETDNHSIKVKLDGVAKGWESATTSVKAAVTILAVIGSIVAWAINVMDFSKITK